ncbi:MAG: tetratricopeptide repeat protein [Gammaproteobacteria bacterium]|nr:tetratricopeptide repeat protein [Gammaproteobacteria bacterium]NNL49435.1 tetratricopeptide repeat protein [Woeseiaceae bacterium]
MKTARRNFIHLLTLALLAGAASLSLAEESTTVLGPRNLDLYDGANALKAGNGDDGVRLTLRGLKTAQGAREERTGHANLCAGYLLTDKPEKALPHCNWVLERYETNWQTYNNRALVYMRLERFDEAEEDIRKGQEIRPNSRNLKAVKGMYLDETQPVTTKIEVDERRTASDVRDDESSPDVAD